MADRAGCLWGCATVALCAFLVLIGFSAAMDWVSRGGHL